jgi:hypothetical protein
MTCSPDSFVFISVITLASVRLALAKEEEQSLQSGACISLHEDCSPSILISSGLELEEQQYIF